MTIKKNILTIFILLFSLSNMLAQEDNNSNLKKSTQIKVEILGVWVNYELPLTDQHFLWDFELGYVSSIVNGEIIFTSVLKTEPRYYYNIQKRASKGKNISNNSGNYFALELSYLPDLLTMDTFDNTEVRIIRSVNLIPTYGLRRNLSGGLNFDFAVGIGYQWTEFEEFNGIVPKLSIGLSYSL